MKGVKEGVVRRDGKREGGKLSSQRFLSGLLPNSGSQFENTVKVGSMS